MNVLSFNDVSMGDALRIEIDAATGHVFMIGPAVEVLQGEIALADRERSFNKMQIRTAVPTDLQEIVKIEAECFPAAEAATTKFSPITARPISPISAQGILSPPFSFYLIT